jgi:hypothetical protein
MMRVRFPSHPLKAVLAVRLGRRRVRVAQAFQTQQRDAERDPRALEHEEPDVVVRVGLDHERDDGSGRRDERQDPGAPQAVAEIPGEQQMPKDGEEEAEPEPDEVLRQVTRLNDLDQHLDYEQPEEDHAGERKPHANASTPRGPGQVPQPQQRHTQRDNSPTEQQRIHNIREIRRRPEDESPACPAKISTPAGA